jgi:histidine phosphotransferase ChpT
MSGTTSPGPAPDALEFAALLCSRVCHDLISPVGAIVNGLEVLDDNPKPEDRDFALELIRKSARTASARLQFCRLAFGAAGSAGAQIDLGDAQAMARGHIEDGKTSITWNLPRILLPKNRVKLLLNMLVIAQQTIPRGGVLRVDAIGEGEAMAFRVAASGLNARLPQNIAELLSADQPPAADAHAVQPYYTRLLAQACGLSVRLAAEGEAVVVTAS